VPVDGASDNVTLEVGTVISGIVSGEFDRLRSVIAEDSEPGGCGLPETSGADRDLPRCATPTEETS
jgi:hypothetical protein